ncbi:MAG: hypothetical protein ACRDWD_15340 [Acidimicrobiia bacterium]
MSADGDVRELLGAYALDALADHEVDEVEALIARDPDAAAETDRLRSVAGSLALAEASRPPSSIRDVVFTSASVRRPARPESSQLSRDGREAARH